MIDETIIRDLQRVVNDRQVPHRHRNVVRRAVEILTKVVGNENYDPDQTDFVSNYEAMKRREELQLSLMGEDL